MTIMINRLHNHRHQPATPNGTRMPEEAVEALDAVHSASERFVERAARTLTSHPVAALGAAFAVGLLLGKWVKR